MRIAQLAGAIAAEHVAQPVHVERVLQHVAVRLDEDRKRRELAHRLQQVGALSRCSQSGIRRRGLPRGSSSARAAFIRNRAPNSDDAPTSSSTSRSASADAERAEGVDGRRPRRGPAAGA